MQAPSEPPSFLPSFRSIVTFRAGKQEGGGGGRRGRAAREGVGSTNSRQLGHAARAEKPVRRQCASGRMTTKAPRPPDNGAKVLRQGENSEVGMVHPKVDLQSLGIPRFARRTVQVQYYGGCNSTLYRRVRT